MDPDRTVVELAANQGGVVTRQQALAAGLTPRQINYRLQIGRWSKHCRGVYTLFDSNSPEAVVRAALGSLPGAVAGAFTAARFHGFEPPAEGPDTILVHTRTTHVFGGVRVIRCHDLRPEHITEIEGIRVTTISRTVVDLAARLPFVSVCRIVDGVVRQFAMPIDELAATLEDVARRGRPGVVNLREALDERLLGDGMSALERRGLEVLRRGGVVDMQLEFPMPWDTARRFDLAFPPQRLAIEWDGRFWHETAAAFDVDRERDRTALAHGWRVARFTWKDVERSPESVVRNVSALLQST